MPLYSSSAVIRVRGVNPPARRPAATSIEGTNGRRTERLKNIASGEYNGSTRTVITAFVVRVRARCLMWAPRSPRVRAGHRAGPVEYGCDVRLDRRHTLVGTERVGWRTATTTRPAARGLMRISTRPAMARFEINSGRVAARPQTRIVSPRSGSSRPTWASKTSDGDGGCPVTRFSGERIEIETAGARGSPGGERPGYVADFNLRGPLVSADRRVLQSRGGTAIKRTRSVARCRLRPLRRPCHRPSSWKVRRDRRDAGQRRSRRRPPRPTLRARSRRRFRVGSQSGRLTAEARAHRRPAVGRVCLLQPEARVAAARTSPRRGRAVLAAALAEWFGPYRIRLTIAIRPGRAARRGVGVSIG